MPLFVHTTIVESADVKYKGIGVKVKFRYL